MQSYQWAVVGAGPAGIAAVGKLLDYGIAAHDILWIDPQFKVGDFGLRWKNIPSNTKVNLFLKFLHASEAFSYASCDQPFALNNIPGEETCLLHWMVEPLQWVTQQLQNKVHSMQTMVKSLTFKDQWWGATVDNKHVYAKNVVLAIGAEPKTLPIASCPVISLQDALDNQRIKNHIEPEDTIAVFGSSHSAVLILKNLVDHSVKKIINFYRSPLIYAVYTDEGIINDDTGLKGMAAEWAREHMHDHLPANLIRVESNDKHIQHYLPGCTKVVSAVGFERRSIPIEGIDKIHYENGMIAPGLFGLGIAFPEAKTNHLGEIEYSVGLWKFMSYLERVMPTWLTNLTT